MLTPQLEAWYYHQALSSDTAGQAQPLARQVEAAQEALGTDRAPAAVRPAPQRGDTTRVMFAEEGLGPSEHRALFVDPIALTITGDMIVYGTSGVLPLRTAIDQFHRGLLLGDLGRLYSELAASWLWLAALSGLALWLQRRRALRAQAGRQAVRRRHATLGVVALVGLLFFFATGLTWSQWAGGNIAELRHAWGWGTPSVSTSLGNGLRDHAEAHAEHAGHAAMAPTTDDAAPALTDFDRALAAARAAGIDAAKLEMVPPARTGQAWKVAEIDRSWPTQVDQVALHPQSMAVTDRADFATFPLAAKLTRWGIDLHMGSLFGWPNQLVLALCATALAVMVVWGYTMWWRRSRVAVSSSAQTVAELFVQLSWMTRLGVLGAAVALGLALPVMGASLLVFVAIDLLRWFLARRQGLLSSRQS